MECTHFGAFQTIPIVHNRYIDKDETVQIADQIPVEGRELVMTIADIIDLTGLTKKEIDEIRKEMLL